MELDYSEDIALTNEHGDVIEYHAATQSDAKFFLKQVDEGRFSNWTISRVRAVAH